MNKDEIDLAISSLVKSYVKAKRELEIIKYQPKRDLLEDELNVLGSLLIRLERAKISELPAGS